MLDCWDPGELEWWPRPRRAGWFTDYPGSMGLSGVEKCVGTSEQSLRLDHLGLAALELSRMQRLRLAQNSVIMKHMGLVSLE